mmetsp:Transcript_36234/g.96275  ORF Transcript_36234/g.96275 Transcript_36234/m.96275 type:complete len:97 (-) Transcript_36234:1457-1747(-)
MAKTCDFLEDEISGGSEQNNRYGAHLNSKIPPNPKNISTAVPLKMKCPLNKRKLHNELRNKNARWAADSSLSMLDAKNSKFTTSTMQTNHNTIIAT